MHENITRQLTVFVNDSYVRVCVSRCLNVFILLLLKIDVFVVVVVVSAVVVVAIITVTERICVLANEFVCVYVNSCLQCSSSFAKSSHTFEI